MAGTALGGASAMSTAERRTRGPSRREEPVFVTKAGIAHMMGVGSTKTIDSWIAQGTFPPPHSRPGKSHAVWLRKHWLVYIETGRWPPESFPDRRD